MERQRRGIATLIGFLSARPSYEKLRLSKELEELDGWLARIGCLSFFPAILCPEGKGSINSLTERPSTV
ncbi:hypothetical protein ES703_31987 [subsurface metagenome]